MKCIIIIYGKYKIDKTKNKIIFSDAMATNKNPKGKGKVDNLGFKTEKQELIVIKLTPYELVVMQKFLPQTKSQGDYIFYFNIDH